MRLAGTDSMSALTSIRQSEPSRTERPSTPRAAQVDGATPFGAVMSSVRWSANTGSTPSPQLAADEMFEPPVDASTRRMNKLRGNEKLDVLREQSRSRPQTQRDTQSAESDVETAGSGVPIANELAAVPQTRSSPDATRLPARQVATHATSTIPADPERTNRGMPDNADIKYQQGSDKSTAAPVIAPQAASAPALPANSIPEASVNNLARQIGRELVAPRPTDGVVIRQDATAAALRLDGMPKELQANRNGSTSRSEAAPTDQSLQDVPPEELGPTRFDDLIRAIRVRAGEKSTSARLQLQPPRLGYMEVDVRLEGDQMRIEVRTETDEARRRVHEQSLQLRSALESAGIDVQQINVSVDPDWLNHRGLTGSWMQTGSRQQCGARAQRQHDKPETPVPTNEVRVDFERLTGTDLSSVSALALSRGVRRVDVRV